MRKIISVCLIFLSLITIGFARVEKHDNVGDSVAVRAVFDTQTGSVKFLTVDQLFNAHIITENEWVTLPPGVLTDDPYGTTNHYPQGPLYNQIYGVRVRKDVDDVPGEFIPWYFFSYIKNTPDAKHTPLTQHQFVTLANC